MAESFLDAFQVGAGLAERRLERDFRERAFLADEAERSLRSRQALQEMQLNDLKINQISDDIARRAKQQAELDLAYQGYAKDHAAGVPMEEALFKNFSGPAARYGSDPLEIAKQAAAFQREKVEGPLRQQKLQADISLSQAREQAALHPKPTLSDMGKYLAERKEALARGDTESVQVYDAQIENKQRPVGTQITTNPDGTMTMTQGPLPKGADAGITKPTQTMLEQRFIDQASMVDGLQKLLDSGAEQYFGAKGALGSMFNDRLFANVFPEMANDDRIQSRQKNELLKSTALRALMNERGQISEGDRKRVELLFPSNGILDVAPPTAKAMWKGLVDEIKSRARREGEMIDKPNLWVYSNEELAALPALFPSITEEVLLKEYKKRGVRFNYK